MKINIVQMSNTTIFTEVDPSVEMFDYIFA